MSSPPVLFPPPFPSSSSSPSYSSYSYNTSLLIVATLLAFTFAFTIIVQLILRLLAHLSSDSDPSFPISNVNSAIEDSGSRVNYDCKSIVDSLPVFTVSSLPRSASAFCTICLSPFASDDKLRLLPLCRHSFHSPCIDAWLKSSPTCPLCRSLGSISKRGKKFVGRNAFVCDGCPLVKDNHQWTSADATETYQWTICTTVQVSSPEPIPEQQHHHHHHQQDIPASEDTPRISWLKDYIDRLGFSSPSPINSTRFMTSPFSSMRFSMWGSRRFDGEGTGRSLELGGGGENSSPDSNSSSGEFAAAFKWLMGGTA